MKFYRIRLAGLPIACAFEFEDTAACFGAYAEGPAPERDALRAPDWLWADWLRGVGERNAHNEYSLYASLCSSALLRRGRCVYHAAALRFRDRAWLLAGPSGVGKSTQVRTLGELYPGAFGVISGDRPVLELTEGGVWVHPSPWNGKENWYGAEAAPLAGLILLGRGEENRVERLPLRDAAAPVYGGIFQTAADAAEIHRAADFASALLERVPVWRLTNRGVPDSTRLLYDKVLTGEA